MGRDYRFVDKDPVIDIIRHAFNSDRNGGLTIYEVSNKSGIAVSTIQNWLYGKTKKPQRWSVTQVLLALGVDTHYVWAHTEEAVISEGSDKRPWTKNKLKQHNAEAKEVRELKQDLAFNVEE